MQGSEHSKGGMSKSETGLQSYQSGWNREHGKNRENRDQAQGQIYRVTKMDQRLEWGTGM